MRIHLPTVINVQEKPTVVREPTETYSFKLFSVPYLILPDRTKRESHYYNSTAVITKEELIPSERMQIPIFHSPYTTQSSTNKSIIRRNIFLPNVQHPFILNYSSVENSSTNSNKCTGKPTHTIMVRIILYRIYHALGNIHFQIPYLKIFTTNLHSMIWKI